MSTDGTDDTDASQLILLWDPKGAGAKAHSSGGDKPPLRRNRRFHTASAHETHKKHKKHGAALADDALAEALDDYFARHEYITVRNYAMLCRCSLSTARRHIADMLADGRLAKSGIAKGLYKRNG